MSEPLLSVENLRTSFETPSGRVRVLRDLTIQVPPGQALGLVGESGSGKTVTALSVLRLLPRSGRVDAGRILFRGRDLVSLSEQEIERVRGSQIAMIFQQPRESLNPVLTIGAQMRLVLHRHSGLTGREAHTRAAALLRQVELPDPIRILRSYPHELSGGMCQRAMIALCLACTPALLIADEATTGLDVTVQLEILRLLRRLRDEMGLTLIIITHNLGVVAEICQWVAVIYAGEVVEHGPIAEIFRAPRHPYTARLLASRPMLGRTETLSAIPGTVPDMVSVPGGCSFNPRCHRAQEKCSQIHPELELLGPSHHVRCFYPEEVPSWTPS